MGSQTNYIFKFGLIVLNDSFQNNFHNVLVILHSNFLQLYYNIGTIHILIGDNISWFGLPHTNRHKKYTLN